MQSPSPDLLPFLVHEIIRSDEYLVRSLPATAVRGVYDLGANVGVFSLMARVLFPHAVICAFEPALETYMALQSNVAGLDIRCSRVALGDGSSYGLLPGAPDCGRARYAAIGSIDKVSTLRLSEILGTGGHPSALVKVDVEGAEECLLRDHDAVPRLRELLHFACEVHFGPRFGNPGWPTFERWFAEVFPTSTHDVFAHSADNFSASATVIARKR